MSSRIAPLILEPNLTSRKRSRAVTVMRSGSLERRILFSSLRYSIICRRSESLLVVRRSQSGWRNLIMA